MYVNYKLLVASYELHNFNKNRVINERRHLDYSSMFVEVEFKTDSLKFKKTKAYNKILIKLKLVLNLRLSLQRPLHQHSNAINYLRLPLFHVPLLELMHVSLLQDD